MQLTLYKDNDMVLSAEGLVDHTGQVITTATVTAVVRRGATEVFSGSLPVVAGTNNYQVMLDDELVVTLGESLTGVLTVIASGLKAVINLTVKVQKRT